MEQSKEAKAGLNKRTKWDDGWRRRMERREEIEREERLAEEFDRTVRVGERINVGGNYGSYQRAAIRPDDGDFNSICDDG